MTFKVDLVILLCFTCMLGVFVGYSLNSWSGKMVYFPIFLLAVVVVYGYRKVTIKLKSVVGINEMDKKEFELLIVRAITNNWLCVSGNNESGLFFCNEKIVLAEIKNTGSKIYSNLRENGNPHSIEDYRDQTDIKL